MVVLRWKTLIQITPKIIMNMVIDALICIMYVSFILFFKFYFLGLKLTHFSNPAFQLKKEVSVFIFLTFLLLKQSYICENNIFQEISSPWGIKLSIWIMKFLLSRLQSPRVKNLSCEILIAWDLIKRYPFFKPCFSTEKRSIYVHFAHFFCCWSKAIYVGTTFSGKFHPREVSSFRFE